MSVRAARDAAPRAVLLDLGNVLVGWDPFGPYAGHMARADVEAMFAQVGFAALNRRADGGTPWADLVAEVAVAAPQHARALERYPRHFADSLTGPVPGSAELVGELRAAGVALYGLTNWSAEHFGCAAPAAPAIGLLRDVLVSGEVGMLKPEPAFFRLAIERFGLDPARTVFVDDSPENVAGAAAVGLDAVRFTGADELRRQLRARGLPVRDVTA
ncbi:HAD family phosphatase [Cellulomonas sp.]|uniref:HAD family hydrolase n=1 Tax=Cellulomonas sp. TaxID=40001 RepID=UPI002585BE41|nr:HAD family phosphatase [Cellulomonas sp.]MCR6689956.1 HAD family phosphatase [Cellulomonas sp.]